MDTIKVDILGETYTIEENEGIAQEGYDGMAMFYEKKIYLRPVKNILGESAFDTEAGEKAVRRELLRHEVLHSFFGEAGMEEWQNDEELIIFLSRMFPKLHKIYKELGCTA